MRTRVCLLTVATWWASACSSAPSAFPGSAPDLESLGAEVVEAVSTGDLQTLAGFRLSETEHNRVVWPELPAARAEHPFPVDLAWHNIELRHRRALHRLRHDLAQYQPMAFESVLCRGETQEFATFRVHTDCYVRFSHARVRYEIQLFKDVLERGGGHKFFRLYDEDPHALAERG